MMRNMIVSPILSNNPSFIKGMARLVDLFGSLDSYSVSLEPNEQDVQALKLDWELVGQDIKNSIQEFQKGIK